MREERRYQKGRTGCEGLQCSRQVEVSDDLVVWRPIPAPRWTRMRYDLGILQTGSGPCKIGGENHGTIFLPREGDGAVGAQATQAGRLKEKSRPACAEMPEKEEEHTEADGGRGLRVEGEKVCESVTRLKWELAPNWEWFLDRGVCQVRESKIISVHTCSHTKNEGGGVWGWGEGRSAYH